METSFKTKAYNFRIIRQVSLIALLISCGLMFFLPWISKYANALFLGIIVVGFPYSFFIKKMKDKEEILEFNHDSIISKEQTIQVSDIDSYRIINSLRLLFILRIKLKNNQKFVYYLPESDKENIKSYFIKAQEKSLKQDFLIKNYQFIYVLGFFAAIGFIYYAGQQIYYFVRSL